MHFFSYTNYLVVIVLFSSAASLHCMELEESAQSEYIAERDGAFAVPTEIISLYLQEQMANKARHTLPQEPPVENKNIQPTRVTIPMRGQEYPVLIDEVKLYVERYNDSSPQLLSSAWYKLQTYKKLLEQNKIQNKKTKEVTEQDWLFAIFAVENKLR